MKQAIEVKVGQVWKLRDGSGERVFRITSFVMMNPMGKLHGGRMAVGKRLGSGARCCAMVTRLARGLDCELVSDTPDGYTPPPTRAELRKNAPPTVERPRMVRVRLPRGMTEREVRAQVTELAGRGYSERIVADRVGVSAEIVRLYWPGASGPFETGTGRRGGPLKPEARRVR